MGTAWKPVRYIVVLLTVALLSGHLSPAGAEDVDGPSSAEPASGVSSAASGDGYWMMDDGGEVYAFGDAVDYGDATSFNSSDGFAGLIPTVSGRGYWILSRFGTLLERGDAPELGNPSATRVGGALFSAAAATPTGGGLWAFTEDGQVVALGDAVHHGDLTGLDINGSIVDAAISPTGGGYWLLGSEGGIFAFGDASFFGSIQGVINDLGLNVPAEQWLNAPIVGIVAADGGDGYWLVASDGGIFAFGNAPFRGSVPGVVSGPLARPVNGMVSYGNGYLMVASDGGVFTFSDQAFLGSLGANPPPDPVVNISPLPKLEFQVSEAVEIDYPDGTSAFSLELLSPEGHALVADLYYSVDDTLTQAVLTASDGTVTLSFDEVGRPTGLVASSGARVDVLNADEGIVAVTEVDGRQEIKKIDPILPPPDVAAARSIPVDLPPGAAPPTLPPPPPPLKAMRTTWLIDLVDADTGRSLDPVALGLRGTGTCTPDSPKVHCGLYQYGAEAGMNAEVELDGFRIYERLKAFIDCQNELQNRAAIGYVLAQGAGLLIGALTGGIGSAVWGFLIGTGLGAGADAAIQRFIGDCKRFGNTAAEAIKPLRLEFANERIDVQFDFTLPGWTLEQPTYTATQAPFFEEFRGVIRLRATRSVPEVDAVNVVHTGDYLFVGEPSKIFVRVNGGDDPYRSTISTADGQSFPDVAGTNGSAEFVDWTPTRAGDLAVQVEGFDESGATYAGGATKRVYDRLTVKWTGVTVFYQNVDASFAVEIEGGSGDFTVNTRVNGNNIPARDHAGGRLYQYAHVFRDTGEDVITVSVSDNRQPARGSLTRTLRVRPACQQPAAPDGGQPDVVAAHDPDAVCPAPVGIEVSGPATTGVGQSTSLQLDVTAGVVDHNATYDVDVQFGDGESAVVNPVETFPSTRATVQHQWDVPGRYTVEASVTDAVGNVGLGVHQIDVGSDMTAAFTTVDSPVVVGEQAAIRFEVEGGWFPQAGKTYDVEVDFGDGTSATGAVTWDPSRQPHPIIARRTYTQAGDYTVVVRIRDGDGLSANDVRIETTVEVEPEPVVVPPNCEHIPQFDVGVVCASGVASTAGDYSLVYVHESGRSTECFRDAPGDSATWTRESHGTFRVVRDVDAFRESVDWFRWRWRFTSTCIQGWGFIADTWEVTPIVSGVTQSYAGRTLTAIKNEIAGRSECDISAYTIFAGCLESGHGATGSVSKQQVFDDYAAWQNR